MSFAVATHRAFAQPRSVSDEAHAIQRRWVALGTPAADRRLAALDRILVTPLKAAGHWVRLRCLYTVAHAIDATYVNLFDPAGPVLTPINSPSVVPDTSFGGDGVSSYFSTGINLLTNGGAYQQDSAHMFVWSLTDLSAATATDLGNSTVSRVIGRNGATGTYNANASSRTYPNASTAASYGWTRRNSTDQVAFRNGAVVDTHSQASVAIASANLLIGQRGSGTFSARQFAAIAAGGALPTDPDIASFTAIVGAWLAELGAI